MDPDVPDVNYSHYRESSLGKALQDSLSDLVDEEKLTPEQAVHALLQYDIQMNRHLKQQPEVSVELVGDVVNYRNADNVWNWKLTNAVVTFFDESKTLKEEVTGEAASKKKRKKQAGAQIEVGDLNVIAVDAFPGRVTRGNGRKKKAATAATKAKAAKKETIKKQ